MLGEKPQVGVIQAWLLEEQVVDRRVSRRLFQEGTNEAKYCLGFRNDHCPCSSWHKAIICNLYSCASPLGRWDSLRASSQHVWVTAEN